MDSVLPGNSDVGFIIYSERQPTATYYRVAIVLWSVTLLALLFEGISNIQTVENAAAFLIYSAFIAILIWLPANKWSLTIEVTSQHLRFGFGIFQRRIPLTEIREVSITNVSGGQYLFFRPHIWGQGVSKFLARPGAALHIKTHAFGVTKTYTVTTSHPREFMQALSGRHTAGT
ncbi:MAG: hypothetical protein HY459_03200 [Parcubacteria group bacterium]|nr:hypothetical protein [Parcubacteria group bacterium]